MFIESGLSIEAESAVETSAPDRARGLLGRFIAAFSAYLELRRARRALGHLDDRLLTDMGLPPRYDPLDPWALRPSKWPFR